MAEQGSPLHGYQVPILRGVWERIMVFGAPRFYARAWACLLALCGPPPAHLLGLSLAPLPLLGWLVGHGVLGPAHPMESPLGRYDGGANAPAL